MSKSTLKKYKNVDLSFNNIDSQLGGEILEDRHPLLPSQKNLRMCVIGSSGSGKTSMLVQLITRHIKVDKLYICAKHLDQPKIEYLINFYKNIEESVNNNPKNKTTVSIVQTVTNDLEDFESVDDMNPKMKNVIIFDDMIFEQDKLQKIPNYFIRGRHHNCSVFYLSQSFFQIPRKIRLNTNLWSIFSMASLTETTRMYREIAGDIDKKEFLKAIRFATMEPYNFLYIDTTQTRQHMKYRKNLDELIEF